MSDTPSDIESQLRDRVQRLLAQLAHDADQLQAAEKHPGKLDVAELHRGRNAAHAVAKALQNIGDFVDNPRQ